MTDFLSQIWTAWNQEWGVTVATILSIIAIAINSGEKFHKIASAIRHWKGWATIHRWCKSAQRTYRTRKAKSAIQGHLEQTLVTIPIQNFENCPANERVTSPRGMLVNITCELYQCSSQVEGAQTVELGKNTPSCPSWIIPGTRRCNELSGDD